MKCPGCGAFINPAWDRCHACGGCLQGAALLENVGTDDPGPATEYDFLTAYDEATTRLNAVWPKERVNIRALPNYPLIARREAQADAVWLEARQGGRHGELLGKFREVLLDWELSLMQELITPKKHRQKGV